jgi:acyl carrier protein
MTNSSRAPEALSARCPTCDILIGIAPPPLIGEMSCPRCRASLWFVVVEGAVRTYRQSEVSPRKRSIIEALVAASPDSLDLVELVMELEEEFRDKIDLPADRIQEIRSLGEWIDFIIRELPY